MEALYSKIYFFYGGDNNHESDYDFIFLNIPKNQMEAFISELKVSKVDCKTFDGLEKVTQTDKAHFLDAKIIYNSSSFEYDKVIMECTNSQALNYGVNMGKIKSNNSRERRHAFVGMLRVLSHHFSPDSWKVDNAERIKVIWNAIGKKHGSLNNDFKITTFDIRKECDEQSMNYKLLSGYLYGLSTELATEEGFL